MTATGRVTVDAVARGRLAQECVQGFEIVGRTPKYVYNITKVYFRPKQVYLLCSQSWKAFFLL